MIKLAKRLGFTVEKYAEDEVKIYSGTIVSLWKTIEFEYLCRHFWMVLPQRRGYLERVLLSGWENKRMEYYSRFFKTVEVNSSFYRPPDARITRQWAERVPGDFVFTVKLWQKIYPSGMFEAATGEVAVISQDDINFIPERNRTTDNRGQAGALLAQFPPGFKKY